MEVPKVVARGGYLRASSSGFRREFPKGGSSQGIPQACPLKGFPGGVNGVGSQVRSPDGVTKGGPLGGVPRWGSQRGVLKLGHLSGTPGGVPRGCPQGEYPR
jgi:hypothetical protein